MAKRVYSLVLDDDVVECVDRLAYTKRTNRSNMINQILAEHFSFVTPEKRSQEIFDKILQMLATDSTMQLTSSPSESMMSLRSALMYKYNPTVKYSVELYKNSFPLLGELRVSMRTQNSTLLLYLMQFYRAWASIEGRYVRGVEYSIDDGRLCRKLCVKYNAGKIMNTVSSNTIGQLIADYIAVFDKALKAYFYNIEAPEEALEEMDKIYSHYIYNSSEII